METIVIVLIVGAAALFVGKRAWRAVQSSRASKAGCTTCGCDSPRDPLST